MPSEQPKQELDDVQPPLTIEQLITKIYQYAQLAFGSNDTITTDGALIDIILLCESTGIVERQKVSN